MEIDIITKKENKALDRTEVKFNCIYDGEATPKILDVKNKLVALLDSKKDLLVVDSLQPHFGETKALGYAKVYGSKDSLLDIETEHVLAKNKLVGEEEAEEETSEESVEEPAEEVKEETESEEESVEESAEEEKTEEESPAEDETEEVNDSEEEVAETNEESEESE